MVRATPQQSLQVICDRETPTALPPKLSLPTQDARSTSDLTRTKSRLPYSLACQPQLTRFLHSYEFGGPWGVVAIMMGFPILMYYLWICLWFYDGKLVYPASVEDIKPFLWRMWGHVAKVWFHPSIWFKKMPNKSRARTPAQMHTRGRFTRATFSSSSSSLGFFQVTNKKVSQFRR